jgi:tetratricopeptide (TPR) repeat protein
MQNQPDCALTRLTNALQLAARTGELQSEAKIRRMLGEILLRLGRRADAQKELQQALRVASAQNARLEELRVAMTLTKNSLVLEDGTEGRRALSRVYDSFTEGHGFPDLKAARAQLERFA